jgi:hypothetical protein
MLRLGLRVRRSLRPDSRAGDLTGVRDLDRGSDRGDIVRRGVRDREGDRERDRASACEGVLEMRLPLDVERDMVKLATWYQDRTSIACLTGLEQRSVVWRSSDPSD